LCAAIQAAGLEDALNTATFTVFAPNNEAFEKLGEAAIAYLLEPANRALLENILLFHAVPEVIQKSQLRCTELIR
jgi:uncharacterized surface protein with fasciclin (FAS1) repeats